MRFECIVVYENGLDKFYIVYRAWLGKGQGNFKKDFKNYFYHDFPFTSIQSVISCDASLVQARKLILSMHVYLIQIQYKVYQYGHDE